jgi:hypothetical protein
MATSMPCSCAGNQEDRDHGGASRL